MPNLQTKVFRLSMACAAGLMVSGAIAWALPPQQDKAGAADRNPVVVELFQSQGCSSCPPANAYLNGIADRPGILALSFAVTYWDRLGWKDTFGSARFTARQQDYAAAGQGEVATPEMIVNGRYAVVGSDARAFDTAIARAGAPTGGPDITLDGTTVRLAKADARGVATLWLVRYDPKSREVPIRAGENSGRTLPHRGIVRELVKLGAWTGPAAAFALPVSREKGLSAAILVQRGAGGPIIAARKL
jgi:hypothetical protein